MPESASRSPKRIGKCRILGRLGYGKTSTIFRAFYEPLQKEVAVKILKPSAKASDELRRKFLNEARSLAKLDHVNIVKVFDVVQETGHLLIIMELIKGRDLYRMVKEDGPVEPTRAVGMMIQAARALQASHQQQIVHRDVKPQNLMTVGRRDNVKLVDFGLAITAATAGTAGTPHFMSPEQVAGKKVVDKSDIYSLGASFFFLLTGRPPFPGRSRKEILNMHMAGKIPTPSRVGRELNIPRSIDPVVKRMMAPIPGYRFNARDLISALEGLHLRGGSRTGRTYATRGAARRPAGKPVGLIVGGVAIVVLAVVGAIIAMSGGGKKPEDKGRDGGKKIVQPKPEEQVGTQPQDYRHRAQLKKERNLAAERAFPEVEAALRRHEGDYDAMIAKLLEFEKEHSGTAAGERALKQRIALEKKRDAGTREAEEERQRQARRAARRILMKEVMQLAAGMQFGKAQKSIESFMLTHGEDTLLMFRYNRLSYAYACIEALVEEININSRKVRLRAIRRRAPAGAVIQSASVEGVTIRDGSLDRRETWASFTPEELASLGGRMPWLRNSEKMFLLYALCGELGEKDAAEMWLQSARARDEFGVIDRRLEEMKGRRN